MLSFQNDKYPCSFNYQRNPHLTYIQVPSCTCLSFNPRSRTSSMSVSFGCLFLSSLSLISLGSNAILCPFSPPVYEVSGVLSWVFGAGEVTRLESLSSSVVVEGPPPPPLRRVSPPAEAMKPARVDPQRSLGWSCLIRAARRRMGNGIIRSNATSIQPGWLLLSLADFTRYRSYG